MYRKIKVKNKNKIEMLELEFDNFEVAFAEYVLYFAYRQPGCVSLSN